LYVVQVSSGTQVAFARHVHLVPISQIRSSTRVFHVPVEPQPTRLHPRLKHSVL
ncbi:hypothetical protein ACJMK2_034809, partial [Sinanodonta woodiana]